jgi:hypothetical protein
MAKCLLKLHRQTRLVDFWKSLLNS